MTFPISQTCQKVENNKTWTDDITSDTFLTHQAHQLRRRRFKVWDPLKGRSRSLQPENPIKVHKDWSIKTWHRFRNKNRRLNNAHRLLYFVAVTEEEMGKVRKLTHGSPCGSTKVSARWWPNWPNSEWLGHTSSGELPTDGRVEEISIFVWYFDIQSIIDIEAN